MGVFESTRLGNLHESGVNVTGTKTEKSQLPYRWKKNLL